MRKLCEVYFLLSTVFFIPVISMADYQAESLNIEKIAISDSLAVVTFSGEPLENLDACTINDTGYQAVIDLESNDHANYLYTHLMTAMVSKKPVHLSLNSCIFINDISSLPAIIAAEIIH